MFFELIVLFFSILFNWVNFYYKQIHELMTQVYRNAIAQFSEIKNFS